MNIVALDYIFSNIKEKYYNEAMEIDSYIIGTIRLLELQTGEDYSSTIQTINDMRPLLCRATSLLKHADKLEL